MWFMLRHFHLSLSGVKMPRHKMKVIIMNGFTFIDAHFWRCWRKKRWKDIVLSVCFVVYHVAFTYKNCLSVAFPMSWRAMFFFKYVFIVTLAFCSKPFTVVLQATSTNLMFFDPWQRQVFTECLFVLTVVVMLFCFILIFPTPLDLLLMPKTTGQSIFL